MQINRLKILIIILFTLIFNQTDLNAQIINFTNCKYTYDRFGEEVQKTFNDIMKKQGKMTIPYNKEESMKKKNDEWDYIDRAFNLETKVLTHVSKKKDEEKN